MKDEFDAIATIIGRTVFPTTETAIVTGVYDKDVYVQLRGSQRHVQVIVPRESGVQAGDEVIVAKSPRPSLERRWHIVGIGKAFDSGGGGADPGVTPHALSGASHTGTLVNAQGPQFPLLDGSRQLTANWDVGPFQIRAETLQSDVPTGTAPLTVASTTLVNNLNVGLLGGFAAADYPRKAENATISGGWDFPGGGFTIGSDVLLQRSAADVLATPDTLQVPTITAITNLTLQPAGDLILDPTDFDVLPHLGYEINLGSLAKKYLTLHAAELWVETLVAQNTIATIGGRILVGPTTVLTRDLGDGAGDTTIYVKHNEMARYDVAYMEADGKVEFFAIGGAGSLQPEGDYAFSVTRNLDLSGRNLWYAGDAVFNTGATDDGFIDIYSIRGVKSATQYGPTIVGNVRYGTGYNHWNERWAIGNLNGLYGYGGSEYGIGLGRYASGYNNVVIDAETNGGIRFRNYNTVVGQWYGSTITLGQTGAGNDYIQIDPTNGIRLYGDNQLNIHLDVSGNVTLGNVAVNQANMHWNNTLKELQFRGGTGGTTVEAYVSAGGYITTGTGVTRIGRGGIEINAPTGYSPGEATIDWYRGSFANLVARIQGRHGQVSLDRYHGCQMYLASVTGGNDSHISLRSDTGVEVSNIDDMTLYADDFIYLNTLSGGHVSVSADLRAGGGIVAGSTGVDPAAGQIIHTSNIIPRRGTTNYTGYVPIGFYHNNRGSDLTLTTSAQNVWSISSTTLGSPPTGRVMITATVAVACTAFTSGPMAIIVQLRTASTERSRMGTNINALNDYIPVTVSWVGTYTSGNSVDVRAYTSGGSATVIAAAVSHIEVVNLT